MKKTIPEWIAVFQEEGVILSPQTVGKRRQVAGIGELVGPRKRYLLTREEFIQVLNTPLPLCHRVIGQAV